MVTLREGRKKEKPLSDCFEDTCVVNSKLVLVRVAIKSALRLRKTQRLGRWN